MEILILIETQTGVVLGNAFRDMRLRTRGQNKYLALPTDSQPQQSESRSSDAQGNPTDYKNEDLIRLYGFR